MKSSVLRKLAVGQPVALRGTGHEMRAEFRRIVTDCVDAANVEVRLANSSPADPSCWVRPRDVIRVEARG